MPNWCENTLYIDLTRKEDAEKLKGIIEDTLEKEAASEGNYGDPGLLQLFAPFGEGEESSYESNISKWGTKWDACDIGYVELNEHNGVYTIGMAFNTAWSPPEPAMAILLDRLISGDIGVQDDNALVRLYYKEYGMDFCGYWENGESDCRSICKTYYTLREEDSESDEFKSAKKFADRMDLAFDELSYIYDPDDGMEDDEDDSVEEDEDGDGE